MTLVFHMKSHQSVRNTNCQKYKVLELQSVNITASELRTVRITVQGVTNAVSELQGLILKNVPLISNAL